MRSVAAVLLLQQLHLAAASPAVGGEIANANCKMQIAESGNLHSQFAICNLQSEIAHAKLIVDLRAAA